MFCKYSLRKHRDIKSIFYKYVSVDDDKLKPTHTCLYAYTCLYTSMTDDLVKLIQ